MPNDLSSPRDEFEDGSPHVMNLREFTIACRKMTPRVLRMMSELLDNKEQLTAGEQMMLGTLISDRAYGRPRQQMAATGRFLDEDGGASQQVRVYIPENGRQRVLDTQGLPPIIDQDE